MNELEVSCVNKPNRLSPHEHITHIGGTNAGSRWRITREQAVMNLRSKTASYYTVDRSTSAKVYVYVVEESGKVPYLRTRADGIWKDNLLALTECPLY